MELFNPILTNPDWAYLFLLIGILGLLFELSTPGASFPGVVGTIFLILSIYLFTNFPINFFGLGLIALGFLLLILEVKFVTFGALAVLGVTAFAFGSYYLVTEGATMTISVSMIITSSVVLLLFSLLLLYLGLKAQKLKKHSGTEGLIGSTAIVSQEIFPNKVGEVKVLGERWRARSNQHCKVDEEVIIDNIENLTLFVHKKNI